MASEPKVKRATAFFDGQNLFHAAKKAFGYLDPVYDPPKLATAVCASEGWQLTQTRFYTGIPAPTDNPRWNKYWSAKLLAMSRAGVHTFSRQLRYRNRSAPGAPPILVGEEKGIDVRIAIDAMSCAYGKHCDVVLIFSQDQDLSELADEIRVIAASQKRWIKIASAFPVSPATANHRGINKTDWVRIDRAMYDACVDHWSYHT